MGKSFVFADCCSEHKSWTKTKSSDQSHKDSSPGDHETSLVAEIFQVGLCGGRQAETLASPGPVATKQTEV